LAPDATAALVQTATVSTSPDAAPKADAQTVSMLASQIVQSASGAKSQFDLTLHPEGLGNVQVKISIDRDGGVTARLRFATPQAAAELSARSGELKDALSQAGFNVADNGLNFDSGGQGQSFADGGQADSGAGARAGRAFQAALDTSEDLITAVSQAAARLQRPSAAGLDIRI
jgi:flagellar hook-length control protein FliK